MQRYSLFPGPRDIQNHSREELHELIQINDINQLIKAFPHQPRFKRGEVYTLEDGTKITLPFSVIRLSKGEYRVLPEGKGENAVRAIQMQPDQQSIRSVLKYAYPLRYNKQSKNWEIDARDVRLDKFDYFIPGTPHVEKRKDANLNESRMLEYVYDHRYGGFMVRPSKDGQWEKAVNDMPLHPGRELADILNEINDKVEANGLLEREDIILIFEAYTAALKALKALHEHKDGVLHRDVNPENILYDEDTGETNLCDFAYSKIKGDTTKESDIPGTPEYASEHVLAGNATQLDDIRALGKIGFQLFGGYLEAVQEGEPYAIKDENFCVELTNPDADCNNHTHCAGVKAFFERMMSEDNAEVPSLEVAIEIFENHPYYRELKEAAESEKTYKTPKSAK